MVKITNFVNTFEVTKGAFENVYKKQGFVLVAEEKEEKKRGADRDSGEAEKNPDDARIEEMIEKPLASWKKEEVKEFAKLVDLDLSGTENVQEAKDRVKVYLEENDMM